MEQSITEIERKILDFMVHYLRSNTYQPSIREIGERFGIKSTKTVSEHLQALADKGFLERDSSRSRGVRILGVDLTRADGVGTVLPRASSGARRSEDRAGRDASDGRPAACWIEGIVLRPCRLGRSWRLSTSARAIIC